MNYLTEERMNALSAEYALGSLQGPARMRFKKLLLSHTQLRHCVWRWEAYLGKLAEAIPGEAPSPKVWPRIEKRLNFSAQDYAQSSRAAEVVSFAEHTQKQKTPKPSIRWTLVAAVAASFFAVALAFLLNPLPPAEPREVAIVQSSQAEALWLIELTAERLHVQVAPSLKPISDKDYELWMLAPDGRAPVSLGVLPKTGRMELARHPLFDEMKIAMIAVSLEPLGGSPNGSPTEVLYTAELVTL